MESIAQGTLVADRYRIIREIGFGGMGTVWLAYDESLDSHCALKLIGASQARQEEFRVRFECEAKCAAQLRGAHVVDVLNRGQWQGKPFIVMEYMEGEDLGVRLERLGRLDVRTTYRIVAQVARALMRAHALGIVHRDIKPGNVFLVPGDEHEIAKLLDFGVALHRDMPHAFETALSSQFVGTPCYMSPEQASGLPVDARSDLWSLAVIVFECLTGEVPFQDESMLELIQSITRGPVPSLTANNPELPEELEAWWRRATARDPKRRFQSAKELADSLAEAAGVYPLPVSGFPVPRGDAPTLPTPFSVALASRRAASGAHSQGAAGNSYETDAAVTMHSPASSSTARFGALLRAGRSPVLPYMLAAGAAGAALAMTIGQWRPALSELAAGLGLDTASEAPPLPKISAVGPNGELARAGSQSAITRTPASSDVALTAALPVSTLPANTPEPTVLLVTEPRPPVVTERRPLSAPPKRLQAAVPKPNPWRPLAPPAARVAPPSSAEAPRSARPSWSVDPPPEESGEKDYGI